MILRKPLIAAAAIFAVGLSGCVSLLPKADPVQLYTFGHKPPAAAAAPSAQAQDRIGVLLADVDFLRAAQGDEILTLTGAQVAYIANTRWAAPAVLLFRESVERRFEQAGRARLLNRGEPGKTGLILRLEVRDFEAHYAFPEAVPEVVVTVNARLSRVDGSQVEDKSFQVRRSAGENRVALIVDTMDEAVSEILSGLVSWTDEVAATVPESATVDAPTRRAGGAGTGVRPPASAPAAPVSRAVAP